MEVSSAIGSQAAKIALDDQMQSRNQKTQLLIGGGGGGVVGANQSTNNANNFAATKTNGSPTNTCHINNHHSSPQAPASVLTNTTTLTTTNGAEAEHFNELDLETCVKAIVKLLFESVENSLIAEEKRQQQQLIENSQTLLIQPPDVVPEETTTKPTNSPPTTHEETPAKLETNISNDNLELEEAKEMVVLRNLEISPPPLPPMQQATENKTIDDNTDKNVDQVQTVKKSNNKRRRFEEAKQETTESNANTGRSKRQRTQTKLFQAGDVKPSPDSNDDPYNSLSETPSPSKSAKPSSIRSTSRGRKKSTTSSSCTEVNNLSYTAQDTTVQQSPLPPQQQLHTNDLHDVIFYEKNDYLAIRNEHNSFYLCQLAENVKVLRPMIKVKWLDTTNDGKTYFLTGHYDKVPQKSIIMPVLLNKLKGDKKGELLFTLDDQDKDNIMERLKRSLNATSAMEASSSQESNVAG